VGYTDSWVSVAARRIAVRRDSGTYLALFGDVTIYAL
jgi:hypothetical protein